MKNKLFLMDRSGYMTLLSVLTIGAVGVAMAVSLVLLGVGFSRTMIARENSEQAKALVNACAEEALEKIRESPPFSGGGVLSFGRGVCSYLVTNLGGEVRRVTASSTVATVVRKVKVDLDKIKPSINITSWQEVADF